MMTNSNLQAMYLYPNRLPKNQPMANRLRGKDALRVSVFAWTEAKPSQRTKSLTQRRKGLKKDYGKFSASSLLDVSFEHGSTGAGPYLLASLRLGVSFSRLGVRSNLLKFRKP